MKKFLIKIVKKYLSLTEIEKIYQWFVDKDASKYKTYDEWELLNRRNEVEKFIDTYIDTYLEKPPLIIRDGAWNYTELSDGPVIFDFVLPEIPLYIYVADRRSATWPEARMRGIKKVDWESHQADLSKIRLSVPALTTKNGNFAPLLLLLNWSDPIDSASLTLKFQELGIINETN